MAFDGIVVANLVSELKSKLIDSRITKIAQPEKDELLLTLKGHNRTQYKLLLSAGAGLPLVYLTNESKTSPLTAPSFCMLLRKHLNNAKIVDIIQPSLERIINIKIEHLNELGDLCNKYLIIELMGKHSNIIFCDNNLKIIDSIKRVNSFISSVREVLPGRDYFIPNTADKLNPLEITYEDFKVLIQKNTLELNKFIYNNLIGLSPLIANEIIHRSSLDPNTLTMDLDELSILHLFKTIDLLLNDVRTTTFTPNIIYENDIPIEFHSLYLNLFDGKTKVDYISVSEMLENYYSHKNSITRIKQKSTDLRKVLNTAIERTSKKHNLQVKQLSDTKNRDKYRVYGELITSYGYNLEPNAKELIALNYYTNEEVTIPLKEDLSPIDNAKRYFERYNKLKRTHQALSKLIIETKNDLDHLNSIKSSMDIILNEEDLIALRQELMDYGYIKKRYDNKNIKGKKKQKSNLPKSKPIHYTSSDGYDIYVGKNNYQNDELTFKFANGGDYWFHSKDIPGSHVIVKTNGEELPNSTIDEASRLAAYYSSGRESGKIEIDYTLRKHLKKPNGGKPGFVIYDNYSSIIASTDITGIENLK
ncbi:MAG TPA: fibronectin/fibrinogen-binding protein [Clostridiales bacterium]|nr:fibronectin/fibrinogen-binding protein [Clostridiales bacterium]